MSPPSSSPSKATVVARTLFRREIVGDCIDIAISRHHRVSHTIHIHTTSFTCTPQSTLLESYRLCAQYGAMYCTSQEVQSSARLPYCTKWHIQNPN